MYHFALLPVVYECSIALANARHFLVVGAFILSILTGIWWYHSVDLLYICLMADKVNTFSSVYGPFGYLPLKIFSLWPMLIRLSGIFVLNCMNSLYFHTFDT